jgi:hypothetical protein
MSKLAIVPLVLVTAGCFEGQRTFKINADGSGTVVDTVKLSEEAKGMIEGMEQMDQSSPAEKKAKTKAKRDATAAAMGEGVTFVSAAPGKDGFEVTTYAFKDINTVRASSMPTPDASSKSKDEPLTFKLAKNAAGNSVLTVLSAPAKKDPAEGAPKAKTAEEAAQEIKMMKGMLGGLKIRSVVEVSGLVKTSSPNVAGSAVTLMALDFDALDAAALAKMASGGGPPSPAAMRGIKGVTVSDETVTIEFTGKK